MPRQTLPVLSAVMRVETGTEERVEDDLTAVGDVEEGVLEHGGRLDCRMVLEATARQAEVSRVEPDRLVNDVGRETIAALADFLHPLGYSAKGRTAGPTRRDNADSAIQALATSRKERALRRKGSSGSPAFHVVDSFEH
jgi:hypothetical protein